MTGTLLSDMKSRRQKWEEDIRSLEECYKRAGLNVDLLAPEPHIAPAETDASPPAEAVLRQIEVTIAQWEAQKSAFEQLEAASAREIELLVFAADRINGCGIAETGKSSAT